MAISIVLADVVITHLAAQVMICFTTFMNIVFLIIRGFGAIALKWTSLEDVLTFTIGGIFSVGIILGFGGTIGVFETSYKPTTVLPEQEVQDRGNIPVLNDVSYQDSPPDQGTLPIQVSSPNHDSPLLQEIPPIQEDLPLHGNLALPDHLLYQDDPRSEDDVSSQDFPLTEEDPLFQDTSPYQDNIESEQDSRKPRNSIARLKRRISHTPFVRESGRPVPKHYLFSYITILVFHSLCLWFWIQSATLFPWEKHRWELELAGSPYLTPGEPTVVANDTFAFVPNGTTRFTTAWSPERIHNWSAWWWPAMMLEVINLFLFTIIYITEWTLLVWPLALWWRGFRSYTRNQRPKGRRVVIASQTESIHPYQDEESASNEIRQAGFWQHVDRIEQAEISEGYL